MLSLLLLFLPLRAHWYGVHICNDIDKATLKRYHIWWIQQSDGGVYKLHVGQQSTKQSARIIIFFSLLFTLVVVLFKQRTIQAWEQAKKKNPLTHTYISPSHYDSAENSINILPVFFLLLPNTHTQLISDFMADNNFNVFK